MNYYRTGHFKPLYALLELIPIIPVLLYFKGKFFSNHKKDLNQYFKFALFLFIFIFLFAFLISILSMLYKPLFFNISGNSIYTSKFLVPINTDKNISSFIIIHNLAFLSLIFLGSPFLYIPTFADAYFMSIVVMPIMAGAIIDGHFNYILPNGILEISGTIIGSASAFILFMLVMEMIKQNNNFMQPEKYLKYIIPGFIISLSSFLFAWPIEVLLINIKNITAIWFRLFYFIDFYIISVDFIIIFRLFKDYFTSALEYFSLYFYISLFIFGLLTIKTINSSIFYFIIFGVISIYFLLYSFVHLFKNENKVYKINNNRFRLITTRGKSMLPSLMPGEILILREINDIKDIHIGDIITYRTSNIYYPLNSTGTIAHRVYQINGDKIITKGDNNLSADPMKIKFNDIIGIVVAKLSFTNKKVSTMEIIDNNNEIKEQVLDIFKIKSMYKYNNRNPNIYLIAISFIIILLVLY
jgi:signal peptidase I